MDEGRVHVDTSPRRPLPRNLQMGFNLSDEMNLLIEMPFHILVPL